MVVFLSICAVSATDLNNDSEIENSNLMMNDDSSYSNIKLESSNEDSISKNVVNSHDDNLENYSDDGVLSTLNNEDNCKQQSDSSYSESSSDVGVASGNNENNVISLYNNPILAANTLSTQLSVSDTHYTKSATYFHVTLKDSNGKTLPNQNIVLKVKGKSYLAVTDKNGVASVKTAKLAIGTYTVSVSYSGNSNYTSSLLSKKVKVLSSVVGSDIKKYCGLTMKYKATFWKSNSVLANKKVSFKINGKTYTKKTNSKGVASVSFKLPVGKYVISTTNPSSKQKLSNNVVVKKDHSVVGGEVKKVYITPNHASSYLIILKSKHGAPVKNARINVTFNHNSFSVKTNSNGKASISVPALDLGTYKVSFRFNGNNNYYGDSDSGSIIVKNKTTKLTASNLKMTYNDGSKFKVKLTTISGKILSNKKIKITINGKSSTVKTNANGYAKVKVGDLNPGNYKATYSYSSKGSSDYASGSKFIIISKATAKLKANNLVMNKGDGSYYKVTVKDKSGKVVKNVFVKSTINGKSYLYSTNSKGVAKLKITKGVGYYSITTVVSDPCYKSKSVSKHVLVNGTKFVTSDLYISSGNSGTFSVTLVDAMKNPIKNINVAFDFNGKSYSVKTDSKGVAKLKLSDLSRGNYVIKYSQGSYSDSSNIYVVNKVALKDIISSSKSVKSYISNNGKLPSTVKVGDITFSTAEYLYLVSKAIVNLKAGSSASVEVVDVDNPTSPKSSSNLGNLYDYLSVAKSVVNTATSKHVMPNSVSSSVGTIGYNGVVDALSRVVAYYGTNDRLPSYVSIKSITSSSSSGDSLNTKNTITNLAAYLAASTNCQVNNAQIKELAAKLTKDCKSDKAKAEAIFTYVRDTLSYSFYYNTKYGAVGALKAKTGNCVDHSHLLVALFRSSGLAARYVHGDCTFTSGSTYGHVWTQVLIGDTWTVADATSSRNSLGKVANWNTNSYKLDGYFSSISF